MRLKFKLRPKVVVLITALIAVVMFTSAYLELDQSKKEVFKLLYEHSSALIESIIQSSDNTLNSSFEIEDLIAERLLNNARLIKILDDSKGLTKSELIRIGKENNLFRINIFDKMGNRTLSNRIPVPGHEHGEENINRSEELSPVLSGKQQELIIGLKKAQFADEERFAVAVPRSGNKGAIVVNINAEDFLEFRKKIGVGKILQEMTKHPGIEYIVLQDSMGILAASELIDTIDAIYDSEFLEKAQLNDSVYSRIRDFGSSEIYEVVRRFVMNSEVIGIYRIGISLEDIRNVESRMVRRIIIISLILAAITIIMLNIIFTSQNLKTISDEYKRFKTLASSVLENMEEAVIVLNADFTISLFNKASEDLFKYDTVKIIGTDIFNIQENALQLSEKDFKMGRYFERELIIDNTKKHLLIGISIIRNESAIADNYIIVIKDLTEIKHLEAEAAKNEKLTAMGELASGVAHEIRNPINSIGMIAQRLNKEFSVSQRQSEFSEFTSLLRKEVERINKIITQFLNYAKPLEIRPVQVNLNEFFKEIEQLFADQAKQKGILYIVHTENTIRFKFDPDLIKQALMNIIQNAFDSTDNEGKVSVDYKKVGNSILIEVRDNGCGIPAKIQKRIFDLYFTTKKDGNGLGLSIAQKIISQHQGSLQIISSEKTGTLIKIILFEL